MKVNYTYNARPDLSSRYDVGVYDGDTMDLVIDLGFRMFATHRVRLLGVDTPELRGEERPDGIVSRDAVREWVRERSDMVWPFVIRTMKADSFGRYLATIESKRDGVLLNDWLIENGFAQPYRR